METSRKGRAEVLLTAQQISLAKVLAANDKAVRDKGVKRLSKWFNARSQGSIEFTQQDLMTIWKGLFYCMWMADKPLYQEELAERLSKLIHCFNKLENGLLFMECFFLTMKREWFGIDQHRLDKFMMLVRRCLRQLFAYCSSHSWSNEVCKGVSGTLGRGITSSAESSPSMGLLFHVSDIILEELAKVESPEKGLQAVLEPFAAIIASGKDARIRQHVSERIFHHLIQQSPLGTEFQEKFEAWKQAGFPGDSWRDMQPVDVSDEEQMSDAEHNENEITAAVQGEKLLDPRAGKVDVELPVIDFDAGEVAALLRSQMQKTSNVKQRKALKLLESQFLDLSKGQYPLGFKKPAGSSERRNRAKHREELWQAAEDLIEFEEEASQMNVDNSSEEDCSLNEGKKRKSQIEDIEKVQSKRKKIKMSPAETNKCEKSTENLSSNNSVPRKAAKSVQGPNKVKKSPLTINKKGCRKQKCVLLLQENCKESVVESVSKPQKANNSTFSPTCDEIESACSKAVSENASTKQLPGNILKKNRKKVIHSELAVNVQSSILQANSSTSELSPSSMKRKGKQKQKGKGVQNNQENDENNSQQFNVKLDNANSNSNQMNNGSECEQKLLRSSHSCSESPGKRKASLCVTETPQKRVKIATMKRLSEGSVIVQRTSTVIPKRRSSLSTWIVTDMAQQPHSTNAATNENGESIACTTTSTLPGTTPKNAKKVNIVLNRNIAHEACDYPKDVMQSPSIPFDASKKPLQGVLKPGHIPSPVNPFYRKSQRLKL